MFVSGLVIWFALVPDILIGPVLPCTMAASSQTANIFIQPFLLYIQSNLKFLPILPQLEVFHDWASKNDCNLLTQHCLLEPTSTVHNGVSHNGVWHQPGEPRHSPVPMSHSTQWQRRTGRPVLAGLIGGVAITT